MEILETIVLRALCEILLASVHAICQSPVFPRFTDLRTLLYVRICVYSELFSLCTSSHNIFLIKGERDFNPVVRIIWLKNRFLWLLNEKVKRSSLYGMNVVRVEMVLHLFSDVTAKMCWCSEECMWVSSVAHFTTPTDLGCDVRKEVRYNPDTHYIHPVCIALKVFKTQSVLAFPLVWRKNMLVPQTEHTCRNVSCGWVACAALRR